MSIQFNRMPDSSQPLNPKGQTSSGWTRFWGGLWTGVPTGPLSVILPTSTPYTYIAPVGGTLIISGGTVTQVQFSRDGASFYLTGQTTGMFPVSQGDQLVIAYAVPPTLTFAPR